MNARSSRAGRRLARLTLGLTAALLSACATGGGGGADAGGGARDAGLSLMDGGSTAPDAGPIGATDAGPVGPVDAGPVAQLDAGPTTATDGGPLDDAGPLGVDGGPVGTDAGPSCESPCRLLAPQCGCGAQSCDVDDTGALGCRDVGSGGEGAECEFDTDCGLGLSCIYDGFFGYCARFCADDGDCSSGSGSRCLETLPDAPSIEMCTVHCDPVGGTDCPIGFGCDVLLEGGSWYTTCRESFFGGAYELCTESVDCDDGLFCVPTDHGRECLRACEFPSGLGCLGAEACGRFGDMPTVDGVEYGWCHV